MEKKEFGRQEKYIKNNIQRVVLNLNKNTDTDLIEWVESLENKQGTIKEILRNHIANL